ncbi:MAG: hypothetical protein WC699_11160 [Bacteroidales bacterium]|jgi:hypothetical protein
MKKFSFPAFAVIVAAIVFGLMMIQKCEPDNGILTWKKIDGKQVLMAGEMQVGYLSGESATGIKSKDKIEQISEGVYRIRRTSMNKTGESMDFVRLTLDFVHADTASYLMIPSVSYQGNTWGRGLEPKGYKKDGQWWSFSYSRSAVPGATYSEGGKWAVALWGDPNPLNLPFSCSLMPVGKETTHRLIWPEEEMPLTYSNRDTYQPGFQGKLSLAAGESVIHSAVLVVTPLMPRHESIKVFLSTAWDIIPHPTIAVRTPAEIWNLSVRFINENLWAEEGIFKGFSIGLWLRDGNWIQRPVWKYEIGWAGQNISTANSFLTDFLWNKNQQSLDRGITCLDTWATYCPLPNGLIRNHFDYVLGFEKSEEVLDACNLGDAAADYLVAWDLAKKCGVERENYKTIALGICDFMLKDQQSSGQYGKGWTREGVCLYRDGTVGSFIIPAMVRAYSVTGNKAYLASARRAYDFYFDDFSTKGFTSAGALDTWCIDKESSWPMLRSAIMLHEATGDSTYLAKAESTSWYLSTWLWHYSVPFADSTDFRKYGYNTFGATAVSTQHHHLDPFGLALVPEWLKLSKLTGNPVWKEKALAAWANANQVVANGTEKVHGVVRPAGSQTEAYFQTRWNGKPGSFADWMVLWPSAFRLETLRTIGLEGLEYLPKQKMN